MCKKCVKKLCYYYLIFWYLYFKMCFLNIFYSYYLSIKSIDTRSVGTKLSRQHRGSRERAHGVDTDARVDQEHHTGHVEGYARASRSSGERVRQTSGGDRGSQGEDGESARERAGRDLASGEQHSRVEEGDQGERGADESRSDTASRSIVSTWHRAMS